MGKLLVLADEHMQFLVVNADVVFYHFKWCFAFANIVLDEVEHHIGIVHRGFTVTFLRKAIVVVPRLHYFYKFVYAMVERAGSRIIGQHLAHFFFGETHHLVKIRFEGIVGADMKATGEVIHCYRTNTSDEAAFYTGVRFCLHLVEEGTQVAFTVRLVSIAVQAFGVREDGISKMVILIYE